ncbi:MAG: sigma 54-interacting transcriptional regulator [Pseudomonadota bacterium]
MPVLFAFREDRFGFRFEVGERAVLGRSPDCELILFDRATSRLHAEIVKTEDGYLLKDLGSTNGTYHNEEKVDGQVPLKKNDEIRVGQEVFLFDPSLDVAVGREGAVLMVGDLGEDPEGVITGPPEPDMSSLDRANLAPLFQVAQALSNRPKKGRVLKQTAYALNRLFGASAVALLWPESSEARNLSALLSRPADRRLALPQAMVDLIYGQNVSVLWPWALAEVNFVKGERQVTRADNTSMCIPLKAFGELGGLLYIESDSRKYGAKDLSFFTAVSGLVASALVNAGLIGQLEQKLVREEESWKEINFVGEDPQIITLLGTVRQVSQTDARVLLTGEVGTGKEVLAKQIHAFSPRRNGAYISLNCSAFAPGQVESVLFGQEAGALSEEGVPGVLEQADGGTVFIRHVDHLPLSAQVELLRTIEEKVVYRVGSTQPRPSNFRTVASSSLDIESLVEKGDFREDLAGRLSEVVLTMPPLRELKGDIPILAKHFLSLAARERGITPPEIDRAAIDCLRSYPWPGNVGELKNLAEILVMFCTGDRIVLDDLPSEFRLAAEAFKLAPGERHSETLIEVEKILIRRALARTNNTMDRAAEILGMNPVELKQLLGYHSISLDKGE